MINTISIIILIVFSTTTIVSVIVFATTELVESIKLSREIKKYKTYNHYILAKSIQRSIIRENARWQLVELEAPNNTIECVEAIMDDAMCYGFEFKADNGKIYFREVE